MLRKWTISRLCYAFLFIFLHLNLVLAKKQPCNLVWKRTDYLQPIPEDALATHGNIHFIARGLVYRIFYSKSPALGRVENSSESNLYPAFLAGASYHRPNAYFYEILTNPNDCTIEWVDTVVGGEIPNSYLAVNTGGYPSSNCFIARIETDDKIQYGGYLLDDFSYYVGSNGGTVRKHAMYAQALLSSINLRIELRHFKFSAIVEQGDVDLMGLDVIVNDSPVEIRQTVHHRKSVTERYTFSESRFFSSVTTWKVGVSIPSTWFGVGVDFGFEQSKERGSGSSESQTYEEEKEVLSERTIIVPPYTSVEACSFTSFKDKAELPFEAEARYTVKGHSGSQVRAILENDEDFPNENIIGVERDAAIVRVVSSMTVSIPTKTTFTVAEIGSPVSCRMISTRLNKARRAKIFKSK